MSNIISYKSILAQYANRSFEGVPTMASFNVRARHSASNTNTTAHLFTKDETEELQSIIQPYIQHGIVREPEVLYCYSEGYLILHGKPSGSRDLIFFLQRKIEDQKFTRYNLYFESGPPDVETLNFSEILSNARYRLRNNVRDVSVKPNMTLYDYTPS